jgi:hypothetical protein
MDLSSMFQDFTVQLGYSDFKSLKDVERKKSDHFIQLLVVKERKREEEK